MNTYMFLAFCFSLVIAKKGEKGEKGEDGVKKPAAFDEKTAKKYTDQVCNAVPSFKGKPPKAYNFSDVITEDEVYELAFINLAYGLTQDSVAHLPTDMGFHKRIIDLISIITKQTCDGDIISEEYLNAAKNLFLYYIFKHNSTISLSPPKAKENKDKKNDTNLNETWTELVMLLEQCAEHVMPIPIGLECGIAAYTAGGHSIGVAEERLDIEIANEGHEFIDEVIDAVWWMFSTAYARCYTMYYPREAWVVKFFDFFVGEFIDPFVIRWRNPGPLSDYFPLIFGPFDFRKARANLRACNGAAYQVEGIPERALVRPLLVNVDGIEMLNFKTGIAHVETNEIYN